MHMQIVPVISLAQFEAVDGLYQQAFGAASVPTLVQQGWWQAWPAGMAALMMEHTLAGAVSCWPVKEPVYQALCAGKQQERNISAADLETNAPQYFHLSEIVILPAYRHRRHTAMLVQYMLQQLATNCQHGKALYLTAYAYSEQGARLMQYLTMQPLLPASATADGQPLWHLCITDAQHLAALAKAFEVD